MVNTLLDLPHIWYGCPAIMNSHYKDMYGRSNDQWRTLCVATVSIISVRGEGINQWCCVRRLCDFGFGFTRHNHVWCRAKHFSVCWTCPINLLFCLLRLAALIYIYVCMYANMVFCICPFSFLSKPGTLCVNTQLDSSVPWTNWGSYRDQSTLMNRKNEISTEVYLVRCHGN